jgi:hypothetical protein
MIKSIFNKKVKIIGEIFAKTKKVRSQTKNFERKSRRQIN